MEKDFYKLLDELEEPERYKGLVEVPEPIRGTMSTEEFIAWQGEHGERYRGLVEAPEPLRGTMSSEEFIAWQGEHGERYRGMKPEDPDEYREKTTGTIDVDVAAAVTELSKFPLEDMKSIRHYIDILEHDIGCIPKLMELRTRITFDFLFGWGDFSKNHLFTDLAIIQELQARGFDFSGITIDINNMLGGEPELVDIFGLLDKYQEGMRKAGSKAISAKIPNPYDETQQITMQELLGMIKEGLIISKQEEGPTLD